MFLCGKLTFIATMTGTEHDVSHIPGQDNEIADQLSRWDEVSDIPFEFNPDDRVRFILPHLWNPDLTCSLHPNDAYFLWSLPTWLNFFFWLEILLLLKGDYWRLGFQSDSFIGCSCPSDGNPCEQLLRKFQHQKKKQLCVSLQLCACSETNVSPCRTVTVLVQSVLRGSIFVS